MIEGVRRSDLGVVPFFMRNIRPCFLPAMPGISNFMEMNLRTYVHDREGVPGVWFYSLDANQCTAGVPRRAATDGDALDDLWLTYYRSIFNPARLKVRATQAEMPKK